MTAVVAKTVLFSGTGSDAALVTPATAPSATPASGVTLIVIDAVALGASVPTVHVTTPRTSLHVPESSRLR